MEKAARPLIARTIPILLAIEWRTVSFRRRLPDFPVEIKPATILAHKTTDFVQAMGAAIDLVTRNELHSGMVFIL